MNQDIHDIVKAIEGRYGQCPEVTDDDRKWVQDNYSDTGMKWMGLFMVRLLNRIGHRDGYRLVRLDNDVQNYLRLLAPKDFITDYIQTLYESVEEDPTYNVYMNRIDDKLTQYQEFAGISEELSYDDIDKYLADSRYDWDLDVSDLDLKKLINRLRLILAILRPLDQLENIYGSIVRGISDLTIS